jgi:ABC-type siderophore export system fused ATPase/permease subunit
MAVESEKRVARVNEEMAMVKEAKDKLEAALRDMNQGVGDRERELERVRMEAVLRDRELAEARRLRDEAVRDLNQLKENHLREAKRAYEDPA